jgi:hypothetical protein
MSDCHCEDEKKAQAINFNRMTVISVVLSKHQSGCEGVQRLHIQILCSNTPPKVWRYQHIVAIGAEVCTLEHLLAVAVAVVAVAGVVVVVVVAGVERECNKKTTPGSFTPDDWVVCINPIHRVGIHGVRRCIDHHKRLRSRHSSSREIVTSHITKMFFHTCQPLYRSTIEESMHTKRRTRNKQRLFRRCKEGS